MEHGHEQKQAVAIALKTEREKGDSAEAPIAPQAGPAGRAAGIMFITKDNEFLLMHRGDGGDFPRTWGFPGGHQEEGETLEQCARREAKEETGLDYAGELKLLHDNGQFATFVARVDEKFPVTICDESTGFTWAKAGSEPMPLHPGISDTVRVEGAKTEFAVAELMRDGILPSPQIYANIYLVDLRITGTGVAYRSKLGEFLYRDAALYQNPEFLARCNGLPVIMEHPEGAILNPQEFKERICGAIMLPYIKGEDVNGIARIYSAEAIAAMEIARSTGKAISTSPSVVFDESSGNVKFTTENGKNLLIEGKPPLLDHLAICGVGVWDKGGPATGVTLNNEALAMADDDKKADSEMEKIADAMSKMADSIANLGKRMDSMEEMRVADKRKDDDDAKKKADDDAKKADAKKDDDEEEKEEKKADKRKDDDDKKSDDDDKKADAAACADSGKYADAQAKADSVYAMIGESAPRWMQGETLPAYRARLLKGLQKHSKAYAGANLGALAVADETSFSAAEAQIFADAQTSARNPVQHGSGLRAIKKNFGGHEITNYVGDPFEWMSPFMLRPSTVRISRAEEIRH